MKSIEFYYDYGSPTSYLAWTQIKNLDSESYKVSYFPVLLGGIFKATDFEYNDNGLNVWFSSANSLSSIRP